MAIVGHKNGLIQRSESEQITALKLWIDRATVDLQKKYSFASAMRLVRNPTKQMVTDIANAVQEAEMLMEDIEYYHMCLDQLEGEMK